MNQNQTPQWTPVGGQGSNNERWAPQKELNYNPQAPGNVIMGYLKDITERPGNNGTFNVAEIATVSTDGKLGAAFDVAGGKVLDDMLDKIALGSFICIKFCGKARSKTGNTYNTWEVYKDDNAIPFNQLGGHVKQQANQQAPVQNFNNQAAPNFQNNMAPVQNAPVFQQPVQNTQSPPVFNQPGFIVPAPNANQAPTVQQQQYVVPVHQNTQSAPAVPNFTPTQTNQQAPVQNAPGQFGGQPLPANPFPGNNNGSGLPF